MGHVIVIEFVTLDGVVSDPDGSGGTPTGGWAFRHGPGTVAGDKFQFSAAMGSAVMLLGRATWQLFARIWPGRSDAFATAMNAMPKLIATRSGTDTSAWPNSTVIDRDLLEVLQDQREQHDVIIAGSLSVVGTLMDHDLVDEYRLLTFPSVVGLGQRLFPETGRPLALTCLSAAQSGAVVLTRYGRAW